MLNSEVAQYAKLNKISVAEAHSVPILRIGGYLDGYQQGKADAIEECEKSVLSAWRKCIKEYPLSDRTPFTNMVNEIMDGFEQLKAVERSRE